MADRKYEPNSYDSGKLVRTYRLKPETVEAIDRACESLEVWPSRLVELLILDGLKRLATGDLPIKRKPVKYEIHL